MKWDTTNHIATSLMFWTSEFCLKLLEYYLEDRNIPEILVCNHLKVELELLAQPAKIFGIHNNISSNGEGRPGHTIMCSSSHADKKNII